MLALQVWMAPGQTQGEGRPAAVAKQGSDVLSWGGGRSTTGQGQTLLPRQLGAVCDSGQELLRPPLVQVNGHEVCGQRRRLGSEAASQISQCLSLRTDHKPLPHTQMQQALERSRSNSSALPNPVGLEPSRAQVRVGGSGGDSLRAGEGSLCSRGLGVFSTYCTGLGPLAPAGPLPSCCSTCCQAVGRGQSG